jgi:hypothetical protein
MSDELTALRRANPRRADLSRSVDALADTLHARVVHDVTALDIPARTPVRRRFVGVSLASASLAAVAAAAAFFAVGSPSSGTGVESAAAAVQKAATLTAASAEKSGTAVVRMTHDGQPWAGKTIRWNRGDIAVTGDDPVLAGRAGEEWLLADGHLYGLGGPDRPGWIDLGSPSNIDPDSGTTPAEYLEAVREDVGGATLRRITAGMSGLTSTGLADGSTAYRGDVAAGIVARETGFKEGQAIRVLPFGYVAQDEAANPAAPLDVAVTVQDGVVREIAVSWGTAASPWTYTVSYSALGATPAPKALANATSIRDLRRIGSR